MTFLTATPTPETQALGQNVALELMDTAAAVRTTLDSIRAADRQDGRIEFQRLLTSYRRFCSDWLVPRSVQGVRPHRWGLPFEPSLDELDLTRSTATELWFHQTPVYDGGEELVDAADVQVPRAFFLDPEGWMAAERPNRISRTEALERDAYTREHNRRQQAVALLTGLGYTIAEPQREDLPTT